MALSLTGKARPIWLADLTGSYCVEAKKAVTWGGPAASGGGRREERRGERPGGMARLQFTPSPLTPSPRLASQRWGVGNRAETVKTAPIFGKKPKVERARFCCLGPGKGQVHMEKGWLRREHRACWPAGEEGGRCVAKAERINSE